MATITGTSADESFLGEEGDDLIRGKGGDDNLYGFSVQGQGKEDGRDTLLGGGGRDELWGGTNNDLLDGGGREDLLDGGEGRDTLYGDRGEDSLYGGRGADRLYGGEGADALRGNEGRDRFVFDSPEDSFQEQDTILDFTQGRDRIKFEGEALGPGGTLIFIGTDAFSGTGGGEIRYGRFDRTIVDVDVDGDGFLDMRIFVAEPFDLTADDFLIG